MSAPEQHPGPRVLRADEVAVPREVIELAALVARGTLDINGSTKHRRKCARRLLALLAWCLLDEVERLTALADPGLQQTHHADCWRQPRHHEARRLLASEVERGWREGRRCGALSAQWQWHETDSFARLAALGGDDGE